MVQFDVEILLESKYDDLNILERNLINFIGLMDENNRDDSFNDDTQVRREELYKTAKDNLSKVSFAINEKVKGIELNVNELI